MCIHINITTNKMHYDTATRHAIPAINNFLKAAKFSADFTWCGREFHILDPKLLGLSVRQVT